MNTFELSQPRLRVSDPCYDRDTWCTHVIPNARPGRWSYETVLSDERDWGKRVAELIVKHADNHAPAEELRWTEVKGADVGVDSGQAGFFDDATYPQEPGDYSEGTWYMAACEQTHDEKDKERHSGLHPDGHGCVSRSGFGDGGYPLFVVEQGGEVVAAKVVFIGHEEEESSEEE